MSRPRAYEMMQAAEIAGEMSAIADTIPANEGQARELARVEPERRADVWQEAVAMHGGNVTAAKVREWRRSERATGVAPPPFAPPFPAPNP